MTLLLAGCSETATEYRMGSDGRYHKVGTVTEGGLWRRSVQEYIAKEQAGTLQKQFHEPAKQFWQGWYHDIRLYRTPFWEDAEFKTSEDMVTYIKQQRHAAGLPTYD